MTKCPVTRALDKLKRFAGLPVPHAVKWIDDKPDFRQMDLEKYAEAINRRLCGVCGDPLGEKCYWIGGPKSFRSKLFTDLPMHQACAVESIRLCPFLNGTRQDYRGYVRTMPQMVVEGRPEKMLLMRGRTANIAVAEMETMHACLYAGRLEVVGQF